MGGIDKEVVKVWVAPTKRQQRCGDVDKEVKVWVMLTKRR